MKTTRITLALLVVCPAIAWIGSAYAQSPAKVYRVGCMSIIPQVPWTEQFLETFKKRLHKLSDFEGQKVIRYRRWADNRSSRPPSLAAEFVALKPDVIVAATVPGANAAKQVTTITIDFVSVGDPH